MNEGKKEKLGREKLKKGGILKWKLKRRKKMEMNKKRGQRIQKK